MSKINLVTCHCESSEAIQNLYTTERLRLLRRLAPRNDMLAFFVMTE